MGGGGEGGQKSAKKVSRIIWMAPKKHVFYLLYLTNDHLLIFNNITPSGQRPSINNSPELLLFDYSLLHFGPSINDVTEFRAILSPHCHAL